MAKNPNHAVYESDMRVSATQSANFGPNPQNEGRKNGNMSSKLHGLRVHLA